MARYSIANSVNSNKLQTAAQFSNSFLLKPRQGLKYSKISISQKRMASIIKWVKQFENSEELNLSVESTLADLSFGVEAEKFERALKFVGEMLGCHSSRPDKEFNEGPDNLWALSDNDFILFEAKSEVELHRAEINKEESGQINESCAWFVRNYKGCHLRSILIITTRKLASSAALRYSTKIMRNDDLRRLKEKIRGFFKEFRGINLKDDIAKDWIQSRINFHYLSDDKLKTEYGQNPK